MKFIRVHTKGKFCFSHASLPLSGPSSSVGSELAPRGPGGAEEEMLLLEFLVNSHDLIGTR